MDNEMMPGVAILVLSLVLTACAPFPLEDSEPWSKGTDLSGQETYVVTFPTPEWTAPDMTCTPLPEDMMIEVVPLSSTSFLLTVSGLQPGEYLYVTYERDLPDWRRGKGYTTFRPVHPVGEDGVFMDRKGGCEALPGVEPNRWLAKVAHARGVACANVDLPEELP